MAKRGLGEPMAEEGLEEAMVEEGLTSHGFRKTMSEEGIGVMVPERLGEVVAGERVGGVMCEEWCFGVDVIADQVSSSNISIGWSGSTDGNSLVREVGFCTVVRVSCGITSGWYTSSRKMVPSSYLTSNHSICAVVNLIYDGHFNSAVNEHLWKVSWLWRNKKC